MTDSPSMAILSASLAALGYVGKQCVELLLEYRRRRREETASLVRLRSLLRASRGVFLVQNDRARDLVSMLQKCAQDPAAMDGGFEVIFDRFHSSFTPQEKELHALIRSMTEHSIRPINVALKDWLKADVVFKGRRRPRTTSPKRAARQWELAVQLSDLECHLEVWLAKYEVWLPGNPTHALVYMADESRHGLGFPKELDALVEEFLSA